MSKPIVGRFGYRPEIIALWTKNPALTIDDVTRLTRAPRTTIEKVRRDLVERGVLKAGGKRCWA